MSFQACGIDAVIKVGGSLTKSPGVLRKLCLELSRIAERYRIVLVPGGGKFADIVRDHDRDFRLSTTTSHWMAILAMDQLGFLLADLIPGSQIVRDIEEAKRIRLPIFLPFQLMFAKDPLDHSWDVTSDSISAYMAHLLGSKKLILVTDVDGIFDVDPKKERKARLFRTLSIRNLLKLRERTCVDRSLPRILSSAKIDCYVVNGSHPERIREILEGKPVICTRILA